ncbi:PEP/pyruvate-binding domain-containing protein [Propionivibrio sp.]|uniref:PEP/pyruvate-binding domain-containing protein n=1 Tax=Propionivibrio sp. TaxID=2212460 RepID=UPI003BF0FFB4
MAAFDRIASGFDGLDRTLDWIRLGDNVVWQVSSVDDYRSIVEPFARQAIADGRMLRYIRFAPHPPLLEPQPSLIIHQLDPSQGFESFTGEVHRIVADAGLDAFYVFDCLSELQTAWAADLMMGNFFVVTCPFLFELDTIAWFCLLRNRHSFDTIARIRETTQLLIDLYHDEDCLYVHPLKVWQRFSPTMFFPHRLCLSKPDQIESITDGVSVSRFYQLVGIESSPGGAQQLDSWERFFIAAREKQDTDADEVENLINTMAERLLGTDPRILALVKQNCTVADLLAVKERMIGSGKAGGKSTGMLLSRWIARRVLPELVENMEPHDSWYLGSDVFYTYLVHNHLWKLRMQQCTTEGYFAQAPALCEGILTGVFPEHMRGQFIRTLEYYGQAPIIVRSSSLLEDSFGHAFAGKYESVFCVNTGSPEDRLQAFESAIRQVYASTMDASALAYRLQRGLEAQDEQMAILVQRVSGSPFGDFFMPAAAGVGYSWSAWRWHRDIDPAAGMVRVVAGLGTRAVDRTSSDYPRLISLDKPDLDASGGTNRNRYCQHSVDGLDLTQRALTTRSLETVIPLLPPWLAKLLAEHDADAERLLEERGVNRAIYLGTCPGVASDQKLLATLGKIMQALQQEYGNPVDIEFTVNWAAGGDFMINLLQCRPLKTPSLPNSSDIGIDDAMASGFPSENVFFHLRQETMGPQLHLSVGAVIMVHPKAYYELPYKEKPTVARTIGRLNNILGEEGKALMLLAPGRIGTTSPELGVPVSFAEIRNMKVLCELAYSEAGYQPELSFGSHFFQDLVEAEIFYGAISEDPEQALFRPDFFDESEDILKTLLPDCTLPEGIISVYRPEGLSFYSDVQRSSCLCVREKM